MDEAMAARFGAFIITYERPAVLKNTVDRLLTQTVPPEIILIADNSASDDTRILVASLGNEKVKYHRMGRNSGPAGASREALSMLAADGYQWIFWGDDDNPPDFKDSFERLFDIINNSPIEKIGIVGAVGQYFKPMTGEIERVGDAALATADTTEVQSIAGGQCMIVNADVVKAGILPDERLFFGFEELDFCLRVRHAGYKLVVSNDLFLRARAKYNRLNFVRPLYSPRTFDSLQRLYYSTRNLLLILRANRLIVARVYQTLKLAAKMIYGFRFGRRYGAIHFKMISLGMWHAATNQTGKLR